MIRGIYKSMTDPQCSNAVVVSLNPIVKDHQFGRCSQQIANAVVPKAVYTSSPIVTTQSNWMIGLSTISSWQN